MIRKIVATSVLLVGLMSGTAAAQDPASPSASVLPNVIERAPQAAALPRTGGDLDVELFAGAGLTAAGLAFAITARQRRRRFTVA